MIVISIIEYYFEIPISRSYKILFESECFIIDQKNVFLVYSEKPMLKKSLHGTIFSVPVLTTFFNTKKGIY